MSGRGRWSGVAIALLLCVAPPAVAQPLISPTQSPVRGARVFGDKGCVRCHAVHDVGGRVGPDIGRLSGPRSFYDLAASMWNHLPRMAQRMRELGIARPLLNPRETGDLIAFLFTLNYFDPPGNVDAGRRLFVGKRCVICHQIGGSGGVVGPNLDTMAEYATPIFIAKAMWNHGQAMAEAMRARGIARPSFEGSELRDLLAYLTSAAPAAAETLVLLPGRAEDGRRVFVEKQCAQCHGVGGQGGKVAPELAARGRPRGLVEFAAAMWNKAPAMLEMMKARGIAVPQLRAEDMADLVAYLYSVQYFAVPGEAGRGREVARAKGCLGCHSLRGEGGKTASDLGRVSGIESPAAIVSGLWNHALIGEPRPQGQKSPWHEIRPEEMADLAAFLQTLGRAR